nr:hypothetical protein JVH1_6974 [Rhodococcus sp. JVH1]
MKTVRVRSLGERNHNPRIAPKHHGDVHARHDMHRSVEHSDFSTV